jgi:hypothetical protein
MQTFQFLVSRGPFLIKISCCTKLVRNLKRAGSGFGYGSKLSGSATLAMNFLCRYICLMQGPFIFGRVPVISNPVTGVHWNIEITEKYRIYGTGTYIPVRSVVESDPHLLTGSGIFLEAHPDPGSGS